MRTTKNQDDEPKFRIRSKEVVEQKNALQLLLNQHFKGTVVTEKSFDWLVTPEKPDRLYKSIINTLSKYRGDTKFARKKAKLKCDFVCDAKKIIIEYDERQHFSEARRLSLLAYKGKVHTDYDIDFWIKACADVHARDNDPSNRDEIRAYYDSTRDIEAARNGYKLIRIMHDQVDWSAAGAEQELRKLLKGGKRQRPVAVRRTEPVKKVETMKTGKKRNGLKIGLYLQQHRPNGKDRHFEEAMKVVKNSDLDLFVFPEVCYTPFAKGMVKSYLMDGDNLEKAYIECEKLSLSIGKPIIFSGTDKSRSKRDDYGSIFSLFVNPFAKRGETKRSCYVKHTQTCYSAFDYPDYRKKIAKNNFTPIRFHGHKLGMTICFDGNQALFSRMYGLQGVDIIINSTGGNIMYDKWYKNHKARAIENHCYELVTMGEEQGQKNSYVYGFNPEGGELNFQNLMKQTDRTNAIGTIYMFDLAEDDGLATIDSSSKKAKTTAQPAAELQIPAGNVDSILKKSKAITKSIYCYRTRSKGEPCNVIFCIINGKEIFKPEKVLAKIYSPKLKEIPNKRYVLVNKYPRLSKELFDTKLELILKVRATDNFCAVLLESNIANCCFQASNYKRVQTIDAVRGKFGIDIARIKGPETIWRDKSSFKASWRDNFEWLIKEANKIR